MQRELGGSRSSLGLLSRSQTVTNPLLLGLTLDVGSTLGS